MQTNYKYFVQDKESTHRDTDKIPGQIKEAGEERQTQLSKLHPNGQNIGTNSHSQ